MPKRGNENDAQSEGREGEGREQRVPANQHAAHAATGRARRGDDAALEGDGWGGRVWNQGRDVVARGASGIVRHSDFTVRRSVWPGAAGWAGARPGARAGWALPEAGRALGRARGRLT